MMRIKIKRHGKVNFLSCESKSGLSLTLSQMGAGVYEVDYNGKAMSYTPKDKDIFNADAIDYYGKIIAPFAGRIKEGKLKVGEATFAFPCSNGVSLHSGYLNTAYSIFDVEIEQAKKGVSVIFTHLLKKSEGYSANVEIEIRYFIYDDKPEFNLYMRAMPDADAPLNLTTHLYWNLGGFKDILHHRLALYSSFHQEYDEHLLPSSKEANSSVFDFCKPKELGQDIYSFKGTAANGYDHAFYLKGENKVDCILESKDFGMKIKTNAPALQIYTTNYPHKGVRLTSNEVERLYGAITFEPVGDLLDPQSNITKKGEWFYRHISYSFHDKRQIKGTKNDR